MEYIFRKPDENDIKFFDKNARQSDKDEVFLFSGRTIGETLSETPNINKDADVWIVDGKPVAIFGVTTFGEDNNVIWMLATDDFDKYAKMFRVKCREVFGKMIEGHDYLYNFVWYKHKKAIKWLRWLGAEISDPLPIGLNNELFCKFEIKNKNV